jgi:putative membrane protein
MLVVILKFIHVATIAIWAGGLIALPVLYMQRKGLEGDRLFRLHAFTRVFYVGIISPAAFLAIGSGTVLIFLQQTYDAWFSAKLAFVAMMTGVHIFSGLVILHLFEPDKSYPVWRGVAAMTGTTLVVTAILVLVLGKPHLPQPDEVTAFFAPGALPGIVDDVIAWWR